MPTVEEIDINAIVNTRGETLVGDSVELGQGKLVINVANLTPDGTVVFSGINGAVGLVGENGQYHAPVTSHVSFRKDGRGFVSAGQEEHVFTDVDLGTLGGAKLVGTSARLIRGPLEVSVDVP